ncbi:LysR family transcriptional regulator [bacterium]|nr:LysR family transcriptional regulator [bacterium]
MIDVKDLEAFLAIVDGGSISHAANGLGLTQPAISLKLKKIESELGVKLFQRTPRSMVPLPTAEVIVPQVREILNRFDGIKESLTEEIKALDGTVRIGCLMGWFDSLFLPAFAGVNQKTPNLQLKLHVDQTANLLHMVTHGQLDLAVVAQPFEHNEGVYAEKLLDEELVLFGKALPKSGSKMERKQALLSRPWVTMNIPDSIVDIFWNELFDGEDFPWTKVQVAACLDHIIAIPKVVMSIENALCVIPKQIVNHIQIPNGFAVESASMQKNGLYLIARSGCLELKRFSIVADELRKCSRALTQPGQNGAKST